jgi:hypothetical protein
VDVAVDALPDRLSRKNVVFQVVKNDTGDYRFERKKRGTMVPLGKTAGMALKQTGNI